MRGGACSGAKERAHTCTRGKDESGEGSEFRGLDDDELSA